METQSPSPYEVSCGRCGVTFPVGTKRCVHCRERIGHPRAIRMTRRSPVGAPPPPVIDEMGAEEIPTRGGMMSPVAILWIVLILGSAIYRACS